MIGSINPVFPTKPDMLETIRRAVLSHPLIMDCVVLPRQKVDGEIVIVAYALFTAGSEPEPGEVDLFLAQLHAQLPAAWVPEMIVPVSTIPLAREGVVDIERLAKMEVLDDAVLDRWKEAIPEGVEVELSIDRIPSTSRPGSLKSAHQTVWRSAATRSEPLRRGSVVIFSDTAGVGDAIAARLRHSGSNACAIVTPGESFQRFDAGRYQIDPASPADYVKLLASVTHDTGTVSHIIHLWTAEPYAGAETWRTAQERGVYSLLLTVQAAASLRKQLNDTWDLRIQVVSRNVQFIDFVERPAWERSPILGLIRTISLEMPIIDCRSLDLDARAGEDDASIILREMGIVGMDREVAWRSGRRLVPRLGKVEISSGTSLPDAIRPGGSYLISGGAGRIGRDIARFLLKTYRANVLLIGRRPVEEMDDLLTELAPYGGRIHYVAADVRELASLNRAVARIKSLRDWEFDGVFHLAGEHGEHSILEETTAGIATAMEPRVRGAENLARHVRRSSGIEINSGPALFVVISSTAGFFGAAGRAAHAASSRALDSFCTYLRCRGFKAHNIAIQAWTEDGAGPGIHVNELMAALSCGRPNLIVGLDPSNAEVSCWVDGASPRVFQLYANTPEPCVRLSEDLEATTVFDRFGTKTACHVRTCASPEPMMVDALPSSIEAAAAMLACLMEKEAVYRSSLSRAARMAAN